MGALRGEINQFISMVGKAKDDAAVIAYMSGVSGFRESEPFTEPGTNEVWVMVESAADGVLLQFRDDVLDRAVIHGQETAYSDAFPRPLALIEGIDLATATPEDVYTVLGEPWKSAPKWSKHKLGNRYLHIAFHAGRVGDVVVMSTPR